MADLIYNKFKEYMADGTIDLDNDTFKMALLDDGHTPDASGETWADVMADELAAANGYTQSGETLASVTWTSLGDVGTMNLNATDPEWTSASFTARYGVVWDTTPVGGKLVCLFDFTENKTVSSGTFTIQFAATGILTLT
jgi:hypothetical protein